VELDRRNFRKRITLKNWLVDLNEMEEDVPHRPGKLYKLRSQLRSNGRHLKSKAEKLAV
jgi:8-oxo-dGTP diphosphatase